MGREAWNELHEATMSAVILLLLNYCPIEKINRFIYYVGKCNANEITRINIHQNLSWQLEILR
jgi:hypothetical protein